MNLVLNSILIILKPICINDYHNSIKVMFVQKSVTVRSNVLIFYELDARPSGLTYYEILQKWPVFPDYFLFL